jgi:hypothetical protein
MSVPSEAGLAVLTIRGGAIVLILVLLFFILAVVAVDFSRLIYLIIRVALTWPPPAPSTLPPDYTLKAKMFEAFPRVPRCLEHKPFLRVLWKAARLAIIGVCYLGVVTAILYCEVLLFGVLSLFGHILPKAGYWVGALIIIAGTLTLCIMSAVGVYRQFKGRCIDIDRLALLVGLLVAVFAAALILSQAARTGEIFGFDSSS